MPRPLVAIIGPGAIGSLLAARFCRAGLDVLLVGRGPAWLKAIRARGLRVSDPGDAPAVRVPAGRLTPAVAPKGPVCGAVFLCVKSGDVADAIRIARPLAGADTPVVAVQNGVTHYRPILRAFGRKRAVFAVCYAAADRPHPLHVRNNGGMGFDLGRAAGNEAAVARAAELIRSGGWKVDVIPSETRMLWTKTVFNAGVNTLAALTNRANDELVSIPAIREMLEKAVAEGERIAKAAGHPPLYPDMPREVVRRSKTTRGQTSSMLADIRRGRPTEADAIVKPLLDAARRKAIKTPMLSSLYELVKALEKEVAA